MLGLQAGLLGNRAQVIAGAFVFLGPVDGGEVKGVLQAQRLERLAQSFLDAVELVASLGKQAARHAILEPVPLERCRLVDRRRGVVVGFDHLGRALAVVDQVEAAIEVRMPLSP